MQCFMRSSRVSVFAMNDAILSWPYDHEVVCPRRLVMGDHPAANHISSGTL